MGYLALAQSHWHPLLDPEVIGLYLHNLRLLQCLVGNDYSDWDTLLDPEAIEPNLHHPP